MAKRKGNGIGPAGVLLCMLLIAAAVFAGYKIAGKYKDSRLETLGGLQKTDVSGVPQAPVSQGSYTALNMTPVNLIFEVNSETGRIDNILVEILRCAEYKLDYIRIAPEVSYTMTSNLYTELTPDNPELPQTVTLSEIYRYYHNDKAYEAGRRIISELINFNVLYYTAVSDVEAERFISVKDTSEGLKAGFVLSEAEAKSDAFGTKGSVKGALESALAKAVTNWGTTERLRYLEVYDALEEVNVTFTDAPVKEFNETCELDTNGTGAILYGILY